MDFFVRFLKYWEQLPFSKHAENTVLKYPLMDIPHKRGLCRYMFAPAVHSAVYTFPAVFIFVRNRQDFEQE